MITKHKKPVGKLWCIHTVKNEFFSSKNYCSFWMQYKSYMRQCGLWNERDKCSASYVGIHNSWWRSFWGLLALELMNLNLVGTEITQNNSICLASWNLKLDWLCNHTSMQESFRQNCKGFLDSKTVTSYTLRRNILKFVVVCL